MHAGVSSISVMSGVCLVRRLCLALSSLEVPSRRRPVCKMEGDSVIHGSKISGNWRTSEVDKSINLLILHRIFLDNSPPVAKHRCAHWAAE